MIYFRSRRSTRGFALPTVVISSIMLMMVLLVAVSATTSIRTGLYAQYYNKMAREAAESGAEYAMACLRNNDMIAPWSTTNKILTPATDCSGNTVSGRAATIFTNSSLQTRFSVSVPQSQDTVQYVIVNGYAELRRSSNGAVWKTYSQQVTLRTGSNTKVSQVTFGYNTSTSGGVFFTVIDNYGKAKSVGSNSYGQLGFGTVSSAQSLPVSFNVVKKVVRAYTNFVSIGKMIFVKDEAGDIWGAGDNSRRALGNASAAEGNVSTPVKFQLPTGVSAKSASSGWSTFVLASDNNIYAAGDCDRGMLGTDYTVDGCQDRITPKRVALPTPVSSNANTIPTDQIVQDRNNAYVIMSGGAVYGWGTNDLFQLGSATIGSSSKPIKIGDFGDSDKPKAVQLAFNGDTLYIVANDGNAYALGFSMRGETGQKNVHVRFYGLAKCMDDQRYEHSVIRLYDCNGSSAQTFEFNNYGAIKVGGKCLDNNGYDKVSLRLYTCNGTAAQTWRILLSGGDHSAGRIELNGTNKCISNYNGDNLSLKLVTCASGDAKQNLKMQTSIVSKVNLPAKVVQVASDQMFAIFRLENGDVYGVGDNTKGALGNYASGGAGYVVSAIRFELPSGVKAVDLYTTAHVLEVNNNFVVGNDGKVYGAGDNQYGQLGNGATSGQSNIPVVMKLFGETASSPIAKSVQSGGGTTVVFTADGTVYTVGNNDRGQLGDGTTTNKYIPIKGQYTNVSRGYLYY